MPGTKTVSAILSLQPYGCSVMFIKSISFIILIYEGTLGVYFWKITKTFLLMLTLFCSLVFIQPMNH